jgi:hypothetical protein
MEQYKEEFAERLQMANFDVNHITDDARKAYAIGILDTMLARHEITSEEHTELWLFIRDFKFE